MLQETVLRGERLLVTWEILKDGFVLLVESGLLIFRFTTYQSIIAALPRSRDRRLRPCLINCGLTPVRWSYHYTTPAC